MGYSFLFLMIAALAGLLMAVQGTINSVLGKAIGLTITTFIVHAVAAISLLLLLLFNQQSDFDFTVIRKAPWYLYLGGLLGIAITYGVAWSIPKLGVAVATTAIIAAQVITASLIDHLGILGLEKVPFTYLRLIGIILLAVGVKLMLME